MREYRQRRESDSQSQSSAGSLGSTASEVSLSYRVPESILPPALSGLSGYLLRIAKKLRPIPVLPQILDSVATGVRFCSFHIEALLPSDSISRSSSSGLHLLDRADGTVDDSCDRLAAVSEGGEESDDHEDPSAKELQPRDRQLNQDGLFRTQSGRSPREDLRANGQTISIARSPSGAEPASGHRPYVAEDRDHIIRTIGQQSETRHSPRRSLAASTTPVS